MPRACLLDPSITSRDGSPPGNLGDLIVRQAVMRELTELLPGYDWVWVPTQMPLTAEELERVLRRYPGGLPERREP